MLVATEMLIHFMEMLKGVIIIMEIIRDIIMMPRITMTMKKRRDLQITGYMLRVFQEIPRKPLYLRYPEVTNLELRLTNSKTLNGCGKFKITTAILRE